jgi:hypothetical protein
MSAVIQRVMAMSEVRTSRNGVPAEVHALLTYWGNWRSRNQVGPQGYPRASPFVKSALYGKLGIPQESNVRVDSDEMPALVEQMERIVEKAPIQIREVILARYKSPLTVCGNEQPIESMAKSVAMSVSTFRNRLESAQWYVYARMYS